MNLNLKSLYVVKDRLFPFVLFDFLFLTLPGVAFVFYFKYSLFMELDWLKLMLISGAIIAPLVLINTIMTLSLAELKKSNAQNEDYLFASLSVGILMSGFILYIAIALNYFFNQSFKTIVLVIVTVEAILLLIDLGYIWKKDKQEKQNLNS